MGTRREFGFTDVDGRSRLGMKDIDWSVVPEALRTLILDGMQLQAEWLHVVAARSDRYVARWSPASRDAIRSPASPSSPPPPR